MVDNKKSFLTIGELVKKFKKYYPDLTSSKLRFLESKGLISPRRADNKYRVFFKNDVRKINLILRMQKDYFLPLEVIKEKLDIINVENVKINNDKGVLKELQTNLDNTDKNLKIKKITLSEASSKYHLPMDYLNELKEENIIDFIEEDGKQFVEGPDLEILRIISDLTKYGIQPKHLKIFENTSYRLSSFLQQIVYPLVMSKNKDSYKRAARILYKLEDDFLELLKTLFKKENKKFLDSHK